MKRYVRTAGFLVTGSLLLGLFLWGFTGLAPFGEYPGPYGDVLNSVAVSERHITNLASAVNFDYRGFDTIGEEYILFAAVVGLALVLRTMRGETEDSPQPFANDRQVPPENDAVRWGGLLLTAAVCLFGLYIVAHAHLTPGGGFQGGVILGTGCLLVYLALGYGVWKRVTPHSWIETAEAAGAGGYVLIGLGTLVACSVFLDNVLPLGQTGKLFSAGFVPIINLAVGLEVAGGFALMFLEFLKHLRKPADKEES